jgi:glutathione peroxidase
MIKQLFLTVALIISLPIALAIPFVLSASELHDIPLTTLKNQSSSLKDYSGKVCLIVNTASECGLTTQYKDLQALHDRFKDKGFSVLGFPCNDFGEQEPGTAEQIQNFCTTQYSVTFPMFAKVHVKGQDQHPLYAQLTGASSPFPGDVTWNFGKFLINREGKLIARFEPQTSPTDSAIVSALEAALK